MKKALLLTLLLMPPLSRAFEDVSLLQNIPLGKTVKKPSALLAFADGRILVSEEAGGLLVFSREGKLLDRWAGPGKGPGQLQNPAGLALDGEENIYVADRGNRRIQVFSPAGKFLSSIGGPAQLKDPADVLVTPDGYVFALDAGSSKVRVFSPEGLPYFSFGAAGKDGGQFKDATRLAFSPAGRILVLDEGNRRIQEFSPLGKFLGVLGKGGDGALKAPRCLAQSPGAVFVLEAGEERVKGFSPEGRYLGVFGAKGKGPGQFGEIADIAARGQELSVLDAGHRRVQVFKISELPPAPDLPFVTMRLKTRASPAVKLALDQMAFSGDGLIAVSAKKGQIFTVADIGKTAPFFWPKGRENPGARSPAAVAASESTAYVAQENGKILAFDLQGRPVPPGSFGGPGKKDGQFKELADIAANGQKLYGLDSSLGRVQVFSKGGIYLFGFGAAGKQKGQLTRPVKIAATSRHVAVLDAGRPALLFYDGKGKFLAEATAPFDKPVDVAAGPGGFFTLLDASGRLHVFAPDAQWLGGFEGREGLAPAKALEFDASRRLWVSAGDALHPFQVALLPKAPDGFKGVSKEGEVSFVWDADPEKLSDSYRLRRSSAMDGDGAVIGAVPSTAPLVFVDQDVIPGVTYYYQLSGVTGPSPDWEGPRTRASIWVARPANLPALDLPKILLGNVFSAQYKYYATNSVGQVGLKNNTEKTFLNLKLAFHILDFMDFPTERPIARLGPGERLDFDLDAVFNNKILSVSEDTPLTAKLTVTYYEDGQEKTFERTQSFTLYSRNAMSWEDPRRIATFVTPKDPVLLEWARSLLKFREEEPFLNPALASAQVIFNGLGAYGVSYLKDPNNPYDKAVQNASRIDYVQFPRETLSRKSGDCDDLAALYASALEAAAVPTALIDVPGHVLIMFRLDDVSGPLGVERQDLVEWDDGLWLPVETALMGAPFAEAWRKGLKAYRAAEAAGKAGIVDVHESWRTYAPATLAEGASLPPPSGDEIDKKFSADFLQVKEDCLLSLAAHYKAAIEKDPKDAAALNDLGNIRYLKEDFAGARELYQKASAADADDPGIYLNLARSAAKLNEGALSEASFKKAQAISPPLKRFKSLDDYLR